MGPIPAPPLPAATSDRGGRSLQRRLFELTRRRSLIRLERRDLSLIRTRRGPDATASWRRAFHLMRRRTRMSAGNAVEVLEEGDALFEALWADIAQARREVLVETYILAADRVGLRTIELLEQAARRGCRTALLCDAVGSMAFPGQRLAEAAQAGVWIARYNPPFGSSERIAGPASRVPPGGQETGPGQSGLGTRSLGVGHRSGARPRESGHRRRPGLLHRDHRKLVVVDGAIAYTGGANISEDYAGRGLGTDLFTDTHLRIRGPAAAALRETLADLLGRTGLDVRDHSPAPDETAGDTIVQVLESAGRLGKREIQRELRLAIECAVDHIDIATPYFVPPQRVLDALVGAARRGVRIRLLTAGRSDVPIVAFAARHVYARLLRRGIRIFELDASVLHAKTTTVDGVYGLVGSANLDQWSFRRNLELNVGLVGTATLERLAQGYEKRLRRSREIELATHLRRPLWRRLLEWVAYELLRL